MRDPAMASPTIEEIDGDDAHMLAMHDGKMRRHAVSYFRGEHTNFHPRDPSLLKSDFVTTHIAHGLMPAAPFLDKSSQIVAIGSCFAAHIANYLFERGFDVGTRRPNAAYVTSVSDGMVNSYALLQQFEWAWTGRQPSQPLWYDRDARILAADEEIRLETKALFDTADCFILTFGLSEVWYDEPTGEVFWRAIPIRLYDPTRHKFRVAGFEENLANMRRIHALIREHRPDARIVMTLSPIALQATFRPIPCIVANTESKAILRAALGEMMRTTQDERLFYFPSYEVVQECFTAPFLNDRVHVHNHVLDFNMGVFERYFCLTGMTDADLRVRWEVARELDRRVAAEGHGAAPSLKAKDWAITREISRQLHLAAGAGDRAD